MVSIVILNYNTFDITSECVSSVIEHTKINDYEIILVDNGSDECDSKLFIQRFPSIIVVKSKKNLGFSKGNNLGIHYAKGDFIVLLNSDVVLKEDSISLLVEFLNSNPRIGIVSPKLIYPNGSKQYVAERFPGIRIEFLNLLRLNKMIGKESAGKIFLSYNYHHENNIKADYVWGAFFIFRKEILNFLPQKKLNDRFFMYAEDMLWCYEAGEVGFETWYFSGTTAIHIHSFSFKKKHGQILDKKLKYMTFNKYSFIKSKKGKLYSIIYFLLELANSLSRLKLNYSKIVIKAFRQSKHGYLF